MDRLGLLPMDLMNLPLWRDLDRCRTEERAPVRLGLVQAWEWRDDQPLAWAKAWREAREVAKQPPPGWWKTEYLKSWARAA
jgi:hypothetical protein